MINTPTQSPLGKKSSYISTYQPNLLFPITRLIKRAEIDVPSVLPFKGMDIWNSYELSWLNLKGKPMVALGQFIFPCESPNIIESKSFKLYLNSYNNSAFKSIKDVAKTMQTDLSNAAGAKVNVILTDISDYAEPIHKALTGTCLDQLDITCDDYQVNPDFLTTEKSTISETLYSDLLKSNCLVTGQPDWGSIQIRYSGKKIHPEGLLKYIISFRNHNEFHEQCVERIFMDIMRHCMPDQLTVYARYTRRGGLDINPIRTNEAKILFTNDRLCRQ